MNNTLPDLLRRERTNIPEVVFAKFKDNKSLLNSISGLLKKNRVLVTKCTDSQIKFLKKEYGNKIEKLDEVSKTVVISDTDKKVEIVGSATVLSAGSSDYFVAEEASISCEFLGLEVFRYYDCGVAGIHRIDGALKLVEDNNVDVVIVVAGMEGALPSIISGMIKQPIIAVPSSVGYGASFGGISALLSMLNSCSPGICVVNIDNGFGAAVCAYKMIKWLKTKTF